jgi:hypothetical protein
VDAPPISRFTRVVLALDLVFSLVAGGVLYFAADRTDRYFAWTIKLPVTATFLGAGYLGAAVTLVLCLRATDWRRVRMLAVMGFTLTSTTLLVTLWHLDQFHPGIPGLVAFLGLVVLGAIRYPGPLDAGAWQDWSFFAVIAASVAVFGFAAWQQERRRPVRTT